MYEFDVQHTPSKLLPMPVPGLMGGSGAQPSPEGTSDALRSLEIELRSVARNSSLLRAGEEGIRFRAISSGWAFRCKSFGDGRRHILDILLPGDFFGIETLFGRTPAYQVWSATAVTYSVLDPVATMEQFDTDAAFRRRLMQSVLDQGAALEQQLAQLGQCGAEERTAAFLIALHGQLLIRGLAPLQSFRLELTQREMADALGIHLIHLNRVMGRLRARKLISTNGQEVTLCDPDGIAELVPFMP